MKKLLLLTFLIGGLQAQAARIYVKANASGDNDGTSWGSAYTNLTTALTASVSGDTVWVAAGTYKPTNGTDRTISFNWNSGVTIYGGFAGSETSLAQRDFKTNVTILSGDLNGDDAANFGNYGDNSYHIVINDGATSGLLDGFTITGGHANGTGWDIYGGAILQRNSSSGVRNIIFINNKASGGGALYNTSSSSLTVSKCFFMNNYATSNGGGLFLTGNAIVQESVFDSNYSGMLGGAACHDGYSKTTYVNCLILNNTSGDIGGGIYNDIYAVNHIVSSTFSQNTANRTSGGDAIYANSQSNTYISNSIIWNGASEIFVQPPSTFLINSSCIESAYAGTGNISSDPLFKNTTDPDGVDNQWLTQDDGFQLQCTSPAINAGNNDSIAGATIDISGLPRISNNDVDLGAYECFLPTVTCTSNPSSKKVCHNLPVTLTGNGAVSYSWDNGITDNTPFTPTVTTKYTVTGTAANGCTDTASITITVVRPGKPVVSKANVYRCGGGRALFHPTGGGPYYRWQEHVGGDGVCIRIENIAGGYYNVDANGDVTTNGGYGSGSGSGSGNGGGYGKIVGRTISSTSFTAGDYLDSRNGYIVQTCELDFALNGNETVTVVSLDSVNGNACYSEQGLTLGILDDANPAINLGADTSILFGSSIILGGNADTTSTGKNAFRYLWTPNVGLDYDTLAFPTVSPTTSTAYIVTKTRPHSGCSRSDTIHVTVNNVTSVNSSLDVGSMLQVFPNPSNGHVQLLLEVPKASDLMLTLVDTQGKSHFADNRKKFQGSFNPEINLSNLAKGVYYLSVRTDENVYTRKLIIE